LLGDLLAIKVPRFSQARCIDVTLNQVVPAEYRADAVVLFTRKKPVFGVIVEAQLRPKKGQAVHLAAVCGGGTRSREVSVCGAGHSPNAATARWAARPIELGGGNQYTPLVVGPDGVPKLTDPVRARREPQLAVLSVMAHGRGEVRTAAAIGAAAAKAILRLSEEEQVLCSLLIEANLSEAARKAIEMQPGLEKFFSEAQRRNFERGEPLARPRARPKARRRRC
jgi:hypothetical protein